MPFTVLLGTVHVAEGTHKPPIFQSVCDSLQASLHIFHYIWEIWHAHTNLVKPFTHTHTTHTLISFYIWIGYVVEKQSSSSSNNRSHRIPKNGWEIFRATQYHELVSSDCVARMLCNEPARTEFCSLKYFSHSHTHTYNVLIVKILHFLFPSTFADDNDDDDYDYDVGPLAHWAQSSKNSTYHRMENVLEPESFGVFADTNWILYTFRIYVFAKWNLTGKMLAPMC